jgi:hypothetical protein
MYVHLCRSCFSHFSVTVSRNIPPLRGAALLIEQTSVGFCFVARPEVIIPSKLPWLAPYLIHLKLMPFLWGHTTSRMEPGWTA